MEININDYNVSVLLAWCGNMDIQFIGEKSSALTSYVTNYQTKAEKSFSDDDFSDFLSNKPLASRLWNFAMRSLSNGECGALEAADTLLQISLFGSDSGTVIRWLGVKMQRSRKLKDVNTLREMHDENTDIFCPNWVDTHYPNRPDDLHHLNLLDFSRWFDIVKLEPKSKEVIYYPYEKGYLHRRKNPYR